MKSLFSSVWSFLKQQRFLLFVALFLSVNLYIIFNVYAHKDLYHIDEQWSYAHSNSNGVPYVVKKNGFYKWSDPEVYHNYLTVQTSDGFNYEHIYENLKLDMHTPLYFMALYTISYFFADTFNQWIGGGFNICLWLLTLIIMYRLSQRFFKERWLALAPLVLYSFSIIGISTVLYIRIYLLQTLLATCLINEMLRFIDQKDEKYRFTAFKIFIFSLLGILTSYNSLILSFFLSIVFGTYLLFQKHYAKIFYLALAMIGSVILFVCIFPYALIAMTRYNPQEYHNYKELFEMLTDMGSMYWSELFSFNINIYSHRIYTYISVVIFLYLVVIYLYCVDFSYSKKLVLLLVTTLSVNFYLSHAMPEMGEFKDRYFMFLYPTIAIISLYMIYKILSRFLPQKKATLWLYIFILFNILNVNYQRYCPYIMSHSAEDAKMISDFSGKNLIVTAPRDWEFEVGSYVYTHVKKYYFIPPRLYSYITECKIEYVMGKACKEYDSLPQVYEDINRGDYLLIYNRYQSQPKYDKETVFIEPVSLCEDLRSRLKFVKIVKIGNLYFDVYSVVKSD